MGETFHKRGIENIGEEILEENYCSTMKNLFPEIAISS